MKVLFDQGVPVPLRRFLTDHEIETAYERGWQALQNGDLLNAAEAAGFDVMITTDQNMRYQQNLAGRRIAILVLPFTNWPMLRLLGDRIAEAVGALTPGSYFELTAQRRNP